MTAALDIDNRYVAGIIAGQENGSIVLRTVASHSACACDAPWNRGSSHHREGRSAPFTGLRILLNLTDDGIINEPCFLRLEEIQILRVGRAEFIGDCPDTGRIIHGGIRINVEVEFHCIIGIGRIRLQLCGCLHPNLHFCIIFQQASAGVIVIEIIFLIVCDWVQPIHLQSRGSKRTS